MRPGRILSHGRVEAPAPTTPSASRSSLKWALFVTLLIALGGAYTLRPTPPSLRASTSRPAVANGQPGPSKVDAAWNERLASRDVISAQRANALPASSVANEDESPTPQPTAEDYVREVQAEPLDASWANATAALLEGDLRDKGERLRFTTRSVVCRGARCFAELNFSSQRSARESFKQMFGAPNRPDCPLRFLYPTNVADDAPVLGILIADCRDKRAREAGVDAVEKR
jgi:hypothetical protein